MRSHINEMVETSRRVHTLRHIETGEYICLRQDGKEYMACFSDGDTALQFRDELGLLEHVDIAALRIGEAPFDHYWLDGEMIGRAVLKDSDSVARMN